MTRSARGHRSATQAPTCSTPTPVTLAPLEPRILLSTLPPSPPSASTTTPAPTAIDAPIAPTDALTLADRRSLVARLTPGPLTASLSKTLRHSGPAAFDASLLKYMERRSGPVSDYKPAASNRAS